MREYCARNLTKEVTEMIQRSPELGRQQKQHKKPERYTVARKKGGGSMDAGGEGNHSMKQAKPPH